MAGCTTRWKAMWISTAQTRLLVWLARYLLHRNQTFQTYFMSTQNKLETHTSSVIASDVYLTHQRNKWRITARTFDDCVSTNLVDKYVTIFQNPKKLNSSVWSIFFLFVKTISDWSRLDESVRTVDQFKSRVAYSSK